MPRSPHRRNARCPRDRGAAAVEFALVLPLLLLVVCGIVDFGRAYSAQVSLTQAAREGARLAALGQPNVVSRTQGAASPLTGVGVTVTSCPAGSTGTTDAVVVTSYTFSFVTPVGVLAGLFGPAFGGTRTMSGRGVMRCQG
jgi:Flp pilus assembly protein TadG